MGRMRSKPRAWSPASRRLVALFLLVLVPPAAALGGLGLLVLEQDRRLIVERDRERAAAAADAAVRSLADAVAQTRSVLRAGGAADGAADGAALLRLDGVDLVAQPTTLLLWTPTPRRLREAETTAFAEPELDEFQRRADRGRAAYERLARSPAATVRAGALLRLARLHRSEGQTAAALQAYADLARVTDVAFDGMPADLLARRATCDLMQRAQRASALQSCAHDLARDLLAGRWSLDHGSWRFSADQIARWTATPLDIAPGRRAASEAADWLWRESRRTDGNALPPAGQHLLETTDGFVSLEWSRESSALSALVVTPDAMTRWLAAARPVSRTSETDIAITTTGGRTLAGTAPPASVQSTLVTRGSHESGLPWDVQIWTRGGGSTTETESRRMTFAAGFVALVLLVGGGAFLIWRVVQRELAVAARQTDFVATVSHEFRTPLASLRHVAELLDEDDELPGDRRRALYGVINRNATRLSGLVDTLLDFTRFESGRRPYAFRPIDAGALVATVVEDFTRQIDDEQVHVASRVATNDLSMNADAEALTRALWNLLDNAARYGPRPCHIEISAMRSSGQVEFAVRDDGPGIPSHEQQNVFEKFVRGEDASRRGIRGTGLGLAIVSHVVQAHGGAVKVESEPGRGSTFRIVLPATAASTVSIADHDAPHAAIGVAPAETDSWRES